ncbi:hypothetical protein, partial [Streptomyces sp. SID69]
TADPTALPGNGNGTRVVPRPTGPVRRPEERPAADPGADAGAVRPESERPRTARPEDSTEPGEAFRGR